MARRMKPESLPMAVTLLVHLGTSVQSASVVEQEEVIPLQEESGGERELLKHVAEHLRCISVCGFDRLRGQLGTLPHEGLAVARFEAAMRLFENCPKMNGSSVRGDAGERKAGCWSRHAFRSRPCARNTSLSRSAGRAVTGRLHTGKAIACGRSRWVESVCSGKESGS